MKRILKPEMVTALIDTREQRPFDLAPLQMERATLDTGDYTVKGLEKSVAIERKSLPDLVMCVGRERERFERECQRLMAYPVKAIVVEATWHDLELGNWRGRVSPLAVTGSVLGWMASGLPIIMGHNAQLAQRLVSRMLFIAARRHYRQVVTYLDVMEK
jgi:DNA excision repair protein ERCC-4